MALVCGTHSGGFHADDVLALALIRVFRDPAASIVRTRDLDRLAACDVVFDVGGEFDPAAGRFDHHQSDYQGDRSSAGMILDWLRDEDCVDEDVADALRAELVDYVDAVDNGRQTPAAGVPCFSSLVGMTTNGAVDMDARYLAAVAFAEHVVAGIRDGVLSVRRAREIVWAAMDEAVAQGCRTLFLEDYVPWKRAYFERGGEDHPTDFVVFPAEGAWRIMAIPPQPGSFANKVPLPEAWAGLVDEDLSEVVGVAGARFCHKNRFIAVFATREGALEAMQKWGLGGLQTSAP